MLQEGTSVVSSDDEASSIATPLFQQSSTNRNLNTPQKKTVLWRDSWDQDAVADVSKSYIAALVVLGPFRCLLDRLTTQNFECVLHHDYQQKGLHGRKLEPRFMHDVQPLVIDVFIGNMIQFNLCPRDLLEQLQKSISCLAISKGNIELGYV